MNNEYAVDPAVTVSIENFHRVIHCFKPCYHFRQNPVREGRIICPGITQLYRQRHFALEHKLAQPVMVRLGMLRIEPVARYLPEIRFHTVGYCFRAGYSHRIIRIVVPPIDNPATIKITVITIITAGVKWIKAIVKLCTVIHTIIIIVRIEWIEMVREMTVSLNSIST